MSGRGAQAGGFAGFPADGPAFFAELEADNSKAFWQANRHRYEANVKEPMLALADALGEFGPFHLFRPYNDVRFAKGRPPYKTAAGMYGESEGGAGYYIQLSANGLLLGGGMYSMASDQLTRFRDAIVDDSTGARLEQLGAQIEAAGYELGAMDSLKTAPRGYPKDHPRITYLRRKGLVATRAVGDPAWLSTREAADRIREVWDSLGPLFEWLGVHVGPSTLPPDDATRW